MVGSRYSESAFNFGEIEVRSDNMYLSHSHLGRNSNSRIVNVCLQKKYGNG